ncbi:MAG: TetR/AcrR family transcriptional regulator [Spirochaeta sp.]
MKEKTPENRERILHAAVRLFTEQGYDAVGVQSLCEAAQITKPTLYHWFGSKYGVLQAAVERYAAEFMAELEGPLEYRGDVPASLQSITAAILRITAHYPEAVRLFLSLRHAPRSSESRQAAENFFHELHTRLRGLFASAALDHGNMRGREISYAVSFLATVFGYAELVMDDRIQPDEGLAFRIMHQFSHGIYS